jgi:hypothetical protein
VLQDGELTRLRVQTGVDDGTTTAVTGGDLEEGMQVVTAAGTPGTASAAPAARSPLLPQRRARPQGGGR